MNRFTRTVSSIRLSIARLIAGNLATVEDREQRAEFVRQTERVARETAIDASNEDFADAVSEVVGELDFSDRSDVMTEDEVDSRIESAIENQEFSGREFDSAVEQVVKGLDVEDILDVEQVIEAIAEDEDAVSGLSEAIAEHEDFRAFVEGIVAKKIGTLREDLQARVDNAIADAFTKMVHNQKI